LLRIYRRFRISRVDTLESFIFFESDAKCYLRRGLAIFLQSNNVLGCVKCQTRLPQKEKNIPLFSVGGILKKFFDERCAGEKDLIELVLENYNLVLPDFLY